jgi:putative membrane protein
MKNAESFFTDEEKERIRKAVAKAEQQTSGEIVPMLVGSCARYAEVELLGTIFGLVIGTAAALVWHDPWGETEIRILWPFVGAALGFILSRVSTIKRWLIPKGRVAEAVHTRCLAEFTDNGLHYTRAHTGILIFASLLEHRVEVLADRGINEKVQPATWDEVVKTLTSGLKSKNACDAFCQAIERCGKILAEHFPRPPDDRDELVSRIITEK